MARRRQAKGASPKGAVVANGNTSKPAASNGTAHPNSKHADKDTPKRPRALAPDLLRGLLNMIMAFDHTSLALRVFEHGTGLVLEGDSQIVTAFNDTQPYILRSLTHLCGPGFTFLLGMGTVYLVESRLKMGWSEIRIVRYLAVRMGILTGLAVLMGVVGTGGQIWLFNMVMFSLAFDYLVSGVLVLGIRRTERVLTGVLAKWMSKKGTSRGGREKRTSEISRRAHHSLLLLLGIAVMFSNHWLSPDEGRCLPEGATSSRRSIFGYAVTHPWLQMWFWPVVDRDAHIMSAFPPFAWLSFSTFGVLYGRVLSSKQRSRRVLVQSYLAISSILGVIFALTRLLGMGNLSEDCLQTPDQSSNPRANQYLASWKSFFYIVKYPPDIAFTALTMSGLFLLLALFDSIPHHFAKRLTLLTDLGTSALFYYLVHLVLIFPGGGIAANLFGEDVDMEDPMNPGEPQKGFKSMRVFWLAWALLAAAMWPLCRWFSRFKGGKPVDSVWRLF